MVRYAFGLLGDLGRAEDLVQEVYLRLYKQLCLGRTIEKPNAWMFCVLRNDVLKQLHSRQVAGATHASVDELDLPETRASLLPDAEDSLWQSDEIEEFLAVLTRREQEVMNLRMCSLKYREIAEQLDISVSSVNTLLTRAIRKVQAAARKKNRGVAGNAVRRIFKTLQ